MLINRCIDDDDDECDSIESNTSNMSNTVTYRSHNITLFALDATSGRVNHSGEVHHTDVMYFKSFTLNRIVFIYSVAFLFTMHACDPKQCAQLFADIVFKNKLTTN